MGFEGILDEVTFVDNENLPYLGAIAVFSGNTSSGPSKLRNVNTHMRYTTILRLLIYNFQMKVLCFVF